MLKRLYADNFKTLVNFDLELKPIALLMGPNGSGKSSIFEIMGLLRDFVTGEHGAGELFTPPSLTRWQANDVQTFELTADDKEKLSVFTYKLEIEHERDRKVCRVVGEKLTYDGHPLYESHLDRTELKARLYRDNYSQGPEVLVDWTRSGIGALQSRQDNQKLVRFREQMRRVFVIRIDPFRMGARSVEESASLSLDSANFVSWFRHVAQSDLMLGSHLAPRLQEVLPAFDSLRLMDDGQDAKLLMVKFKTTLSADADTKPYSCRFDELSEGQRVLILLYSLLAASADPAQSYTLCLDEPDNFVALREIQPWLNAVIDNVHTSPCQALLISHHPELINQLAISHGLWVERSLGGAARAKAVADDETGLPPAELVARGWLNA